MWWNCGWKESCTSGSLSVTLKACKSRDYNGMLTIYQLVQDFSIHRISQLAWIKSPFFSSFFLANPTCFPHVSCWMSPVSVSSCHDMPFSRPLRSLEWSDDVGLSVAAQLLLGSTWFVSPVITCYNMLLVGGVEHLDYVPYIGNFIIPTDFHIFQRGWNHQPGYNLVSNVSPTINLPFGDGSYKPFVIYEIFGDGSFLGLPHWNRGLTITRLS